MPLCSFDLNCSDTMIAAGAELLEEEEDAYLFFWYRIVISLLVNSYIMHAFMYCIAGNFRWTAFCCISGFFDN